MKKALYYFLFLAMVFATNQAVVGQNTLKNPTVTIANKVWGEISKSELIESGMLVCDNADFTIESYTMEYTMKGDVIEYSIQGNLFTDAIVQSISKLRVDDKVVFDNIYAKNLEGLRIKLFPIVFTIK